MPKKCLRFVVKLGVDCVFLSVTTGCLAQQAPDEVSQPEQMCSGTCDGLMVSTWGGWKRTKGGCCGGVERKQSRLQVT